MSAMDSTGMGRIGFAQENRGTIEGLASANIDRGRFNAHGEVLVDTDELTPID